MPPSRKPSDVAAAYDQWAASYDADDNQTRELAGDVLRRSDLNLAGRRVVEIGCGTGLNTLWFSQRAAQVVAIDFSAGMLREARSRVTAANVEFVCHDIGAPWPLDAASADAVAAVLVLEHVQRLETVFGEAARVLRPGGVLFICELHPMRQMMGKQAKFTDPKTGAIHRIASYLHDVSEYVNGGLAAGLQVTRLKEWRDAEAGPSDPPRLLSLEFEAP